MIRPYNYLQGSRQTEQGQFGRIKKGEKLDLLISLGNGYDTSLSGDNPLLIGGGVGVPPLFGLCKKLIAENKTVNVILGFNTKSEIFLEDEFPRARR